MTNPADAGVILYSAGMPVDALSVLEAFGRLVPFTDEENLMTLTGDALAIAARAATRLDASVLDAAPRLRVIGRSGVGTENVDVSAASRRGIPVVTTPRATTKPVAEGALALVLALAKRLPTMGDAVRKGDWSVRDRIDMVDLEGSTLGVVGLGRVGKQVATLAAAVGFHVVAYDPFPVVDVAVETLDLDAMLGRSDAIVVTAASTESSRGMFSLDRLRRCKPGLLFVNVSRGELVPSLDDLSQALELGCLGGVGLDVFDPEPPDPTHPLFADRRVVVTPHALAFTARGRRAVFSDMAEGMAAVLAGERAESVADASVYE